MAPWYHKQCLRCGKAFITQTKKTQHCSISCGNIGKTRHAREDIKEYILENITTPNEKESCWIWKGYVNDMGYGIAGVRGTWYRAHRLSYEIFIGPITKGLMILHSCHNRCCVAPHHLRIGTNIDNMQDKIESDRQPRGSRHYNTHLTENDVRHIRYLRQEKGWSLYDLAKKYDVNYVTIHNIVYALTWAHVDADTYIPPTDSRQKVTDDNVCIMRKLFDTKQATIRQIADMYGITFSHTWRIIKRHIRNNI